MRFSLFHGQVKVKVTSKVIDGFFSTDIFVIFNLFSQKQRKLGLKLNELFEIDQKLYAFQLHYQVNVARPRYI